MQKRSGRDAQQMPAGHCAQNSHHLPGLLLAQAALAIRCVLGPPKAKERALTVETLCPVRARMCPTGRSTVSIFCHLPGGPGHQEDRGDQALQEDPTTPQNRQGNEQ